MGVGPPALPDDDEGGETGDPNGEGRHDCPRGPAVVGSLDEPVEQVGRPDHREGRAEGIHAGVPRMEDENLKRAAFFASQGTNPTAECLFAMLVKTLEAPTAGGPLAVVEHLECLRAEGPLMSTQCSRWPSAP